MQWVQSGHGFNKCTLQKRHSYEKTRDIFEATVASVYRSNKLDIISKVAIECMHRTDRDGSLAQCFAFCLFFTLFCFCEWWVLFLVSVFSAWSFCYFCLYLYFRLSCFPCISRVQLLSLPQLGVLMFWLLPVLFCHSLPFVCFMFRFLPHYLDSVNLSSFTIISVFLSSLYCSLCSFIPWIPFLSPTFHFWLHPSFVCILSLYAPIKLPLSLFFSLESCIVACWTETQQYYICGYSGAKK